MGEKHTHSVLPEITHLPQATKRECFSETTDSITCREERSSVERRAVPHHQKNFVLESPQIKRVSRTKGSTQANSRCYSTDPKNKSWPLLLPVVVVLFGRLLAPLNAFHALWRRSSNGLGFWLRCLFGFTIEEEIDHDVPRYGTRNRATHA